MGKRDLADARRVLALNLRAFRRKLDLSQNQLATKVDVRQALVSAIEVESANPTLESLSKLSSALGVSIEELFAKE